MLTLEQISKPIRPVSLLVIYADKNSSYVESHKINRVKSKDVIGPGVPLTDDSMKMIASLIKDKSKKITLTKEIFPPNILYVSSDNMQNELMWYTPRRKRKLYFSKSLGIPDMVVSLPRMIFYADTSLRVFCIKDHPRKNPFLCKTIFPNTRESGNVCLGVAKVERKMSALKTIRSYENAFFNTTFNQWHDTEAKEIWLKASLTKRVEDNDLILTNNRLNNLL